MSNTDAITATMLWHLQTDEGQRSTKTLAVRMCDSIRHKALVFFNDWGHLVFLRASRDRHTKARNTAERIKAALTK